MGAWNSIYLFHCFISKQTLPPLFRSAREIWIPLQRLQKGVLFLGICNYVQENSSDNYLNIRKEVWKHCLSPFGIGYANLFSKFDIREKAFLNQEA